MELRELRSFCMAARLQSISKAAEQLDIGQPTVTTHIKKLEKQLGMVLFDRIKRPIQLTLSGRTLVELAAPLVEGIDDLATRTSATEERGPVDLASTSDIIPHTLLRVVRVFRNRHPEIRLRMRSGFRSEVLDMVADGEVDLGVIPHPERRDEFEFEALFLYERVLLTPPDHPLLQEPLSSLDQIARWPLILMGPRTYTRMVLEQEFQRRGAGYDIVMELDSVDMIKRYVALGMGISVAPRLCIEPADEKELGLVSLSNLLPVDQAGIVTLKGKSLSVATQSFISVMRDTVAPASTVSGSR
ncbi:MAG: LysR family transcriptional regulator [SAR202 cluster bacterium]|jgi:DNA-binding transcriptional LysR family regulator|nr:LysR family transcriptional regulator [SAR202 cluster bacterium]